MTIHLPENLESSIQAAVHSGQFASVDDAMATAARLLLEQLGQTMPKVSKTPARTPARKAKTSKVAPQKKQPITKDECHQHLIEIGLMSQLPDTEADFDDPDDEPIEIGGEPLSEMIIRERR